MILLSIFLTGCTVPPAPPVSVPSLNAPITAAHCFLADRYSPKYKLLQESPIVAPDRYWLATDNRLAVYALTAVGDVAHAAALSVSIADHGGRRHGLIEALTGENIQFPPRTETQAEVDGPVWNEHRLTGPRYADWREYADLALYAALDSHNEGNGQEAARRYGAAMKLFDGVGFADKPYTSTEGHGFYATYKLALALYVAAQIQEPPDSRLLPALLGKQDESGGFVTLYDATGTPQGDASTETTSYALLALTADAVRWDIERPSANTDRCAWPE
ncbi:MAG: hypothetical protein KF753_04955 [Caldilineaceae bacterium]|nr:hypothetical protein [Caldilineaceae bacterium]